jgi:hypothetical protein
MALASGGRRNLFFLFLLKMATHKELLINARKYARILPENYTKLSRDKLKKLLAKRDLLEPSAKEVISSYEIYDRKVKITTPELIKFTTKELAYKQSKDLESIRDLLTESALKEPTRFAREVGEVLEEKKLLLPREEPAIWGEVRSLTKDIDELTKLFIEKEEEEPGVVPEEVRVRAEPEPEPREEKVLVGVQPGGDIIGYHEFPTRKIEVRENVIRRGNKVLNLTTGYMNTWSTIKKYMSTRYPDTEYAYDLERGILHKIPRS